MSQEIFEIRITDDGRLLAAWELGAERAGLDAAGLRALVVAQGYGDLDIADTAIAELIEVCKTAEESFEWQIGERRDGACAVRVDPDKLCARLTLERAYGGAPVTEEQIREQLKSAGVVMGILDDAITEALAMGSATGIVVARGVPAEAGVDSSFANLVPIQQERRPHADEHGVTDYRDLGRIAVVEPGDALMRRIPATLGIDGFDVTGKVLQAKPGKSVNYAEKLSGVVRDANDPELLRAAIVGRAVSVPNGVAVEPSIDLPQVDMSTGNVDFEGSVVILGDVLARMKIHATGDVIVKGTVGGADIRAGRQVMLLGGFKGALDEDDDGVNGPSYEYTIKCGGTFHSRFVEYAHVESGGDILIDDHAMFSKLVAANNVVVGGPGKKGQVVGGQITATGSATAIKFGAASGAKTLVQVGLDPRHRLHLEHLEGELAKLEASDPAADSSPLREEVDALRARLAIADHAYVKVGLTIFPGTQIRIGAKRWSSIDEHASGVFRVVDGEVMLCPQ